MKELKALLDKYWNGKTDLQEEKSLKEYGSNGNASRDADFFRYLIEKSGQGVDDHDFDKTIIKKIRDASPEKRRVNILMNWRVAAAVLILFAASMIFKFSLVEKKVENTAVLTDTYEDPEKAFEETKKALLLISAKLNKGNEYTTEFGKFSESQENLKRRIR